MLLSSHCLILLLYHECFCERMCLFTDELLSISASGLGMVSFTNLCRLRKTKSLMWALAVLTKYFHLKTKKKTHTPKLCFLLLHSTSIEVLQWSHQSSWQIWSLKSELYILQLFVMLNDITDVILLPASTRMFQILLQCFPVSSFLLSLNSFYFVAMIVEWVGR